MTRRYRIIGLSLPKAYNEFETGCKTPGIPKTLLEELYYPKINTEQVKKDIVMKVKAHISNGFWKPMGDFTFGIDSKAFDTPGTQSPFAYAPKLLGMHQKKRGQTPFTANSLRSFPS